MFRRRYSRALIVVVLLALAVFPQAAPCAAPEVVDGPRLMGVLPARPVLVGRDLVISLSFDRSMDKKSLEKAISFEPPMDFRVSGEAECLIVPVNLLEGGREYAFYMEPAKACDLQGRTFEGEVALSFTTRDDRVVLEVPSLSFGGEVVEGRDPQGVANVIGFGVGHYPGTGRPGGGNFVLLAHSSGRIDFPFNRLGDLVEGDRFILKYGGRVYLYRREEGLVIRDDELWILNAEQNPVLTIFVCCAEDGKPSPVFHPSFRYVVRATLSGVSPGHGT